MSTNKWFDRGFAVFFPAYIGWISYETWRDDGWSGVFYQTLFMIGAGILVFVLLLGVIHLWVRRNHE